jgi:uncharacterized OB-fold protein
MDVTHPDAEFRAFLAQGRFMIQRSKGSGVHVFYPRAVTPGTGARDLEWVQACGRRGLFDHRGAKKPPEPSYNVALIDLAEGPRMMSRVEGVDPAAVAIGMAVQARIVDQDGEPVVVFDVAEQPA